MVQAIFAERGVLFRVGGAAQLGRLLSGLLALHLRCLHDRTREWIDLRHRLVTRSAGANERDWPRGARSSSAVSARSRRDLRLSRSIMRDLARTFTGLARESAGC